MRWCMESKGHNTSHRAAWHSLPRAPRSPPALLSFQQLPVGGNLDVESHLNIQQILVFTQVTSHLFLHVLNLVLQAANSVLVVSSFHGKVLFHFTHLAFQRLVLQERWERPPVLFSQKQTNKQSYPPNHFQTICNHFPWQQMGDAPVFSGKYKYRVPFLVEAMI